MGTDVYMEHESLNKEDQITGFSIDAGDKGYLRASISMHDENSVLRKLFPKKYWESHEGLKYDFKENRKLCQEIAVLYLFSKMTGKKMEYKIDEQKEFVNELTSLFEQIGVNELTSLFEQIGLKIKNNNKNRNIRSAVMWLESLFKFFELGIKIQNEYNEKPKVYISW